MAISAFKRWALDLGRYSYKGAISNSLTVTEIAGLATLSGKQYDDALARDANVGIIRWGENFFAIGEQAENYAIKQDASTATRYVRDNIGITAASMLARMLATSGKSRFYEGDLIISHPPLDIGFVGDLKNAIVGDWYITAGGQDYEIRIDRVITIDEPIAILMNALLNVDGVSYRSIAPGSLFVGDLGGVTLDFSVRGENGKLALALVKSESIGVNGYMMGFYDAIRKRHSKFFKTVLRPNRSLIQKAFATGIYDAGQTLDCHEEAEQFKNRYINQAMQWLQNETGGLLNFHTLLWGGGGSALLQRELMAAVEHENVIFADEPAHIHTAGVRGMLKYAKVLEASGKI